VLPNPLGLAAYRIVQEAVTNIIRHANAGTAVITLHRGRDAFTVTVQDNGQGAGEFETGNGIRGMRERAAEWGGELVISSEAAAGTVVTAILPISEPAEPPSADLRSEP
jgi:signal transduction histidine kinase